MITENNLMAAIKSATNVGIKITTITPIAANKTNNMIIASIISIAKPS
jgi:hypothetical protein